MRRNSPKHACCCISDLQTFSVNVGLRVRSYPAKRLRAGFKGWIVSLERERAAPLCRRKREGVLHHASAKRLRSGRSLDCISR